jgi:hypothetical protein
LLFGVVPTLQHVRICPGIGVRSGHHERPAHPSERSCLSRRAGCLGPSDQSRRIGGEVPTAIERRHRCVLTRRRDGARARSQLRTGRRDLPHGRVHWTGRGELLALRWRDVDFTASTVRVRASFAGGQLTTPKSGKVRSVPLSPEVAHALARLSDREHWTGDDDLVFAAQEGGYLDGSALRRRHAPRSPAPDSVPSASTICDIRSALG